MRSWNKGILGLAVCVVVVVVFLPGNVALADLVVDGKLNDWGVTPFAQWTPNSGINSVVDNWPNANFPNGGEVFDLEAMYLWPQAGKLAVGIVSSFPQTGVADPYNSAIWIGPGDLLLDVDQSDGRLWDHAIILNGPHKGDIYLNPALILPQGGVGIPANGPSNVDVANSGAPVGHAEVAWFDYGDLEGYGSPTYGIEITADWSSLGLSEGLASLLAHYTMGCGNDTLDLGSFGSPVPEPATLGFLLVGGLAIVGKSLRRRTVA